MDYGDRNSVLGLHWGAPPASIPRIPSPINKVSRGVGNHFVVGWGTILWRFPLL